VIFFLIHFQVSAAFGEDLSGLIVKVLGDIFGAVEPFDGLTRFSIQNFFHFVTEISLEATRAYFRAFVLS